jgi:hypothetical protein
MNNHGQLEVADDLGDTSSCFAGFGFRNSVIAVINGAIDDHL